MSNGLVTTRAARLSRIVALSAATAAAIAVVPAVSASATTTCAGACITNFETQRRPLDRGHV